MAEQQNLTGFLCVFSFRLTTNATGHSRHIGRQTAASQQHGLQKRSSNRMQQQTECRIQGPGCSDAGARSGPQRKRPAGPPPPPRRVRMSSGERPIGAAKGKQPDTEALCQTPTPPRAAVSVVTSGNPHRSQALQRRSLSCGLVAWPRPLASCLRLCTFARVSPTHRIAAAVRTARAATACG